MNGMCAHFRPVVLALLLLSGGGQLRDVDGTDRDLFAPAGAAHVLFFVASDCPVHVLFFVASDCPVSNGYAPEIQRICRDYRTKGVSCSLVYEDVSIDAVRVREHRDDYGYKDIAAVVDGDRTIADRARATVTPQAVVVGPAGTVKYRGRIDNQFAALGKPRRVVTVHDVREALDAVLAGRAVAQPDTEAFGCFISKRESVEARRFQP
jgi:hypothetical protein